MLLDISFTCVSTVLQKVVAVTLKKALSLFHNFLFQEIHLFFSAGDLFALQSYTGFKEEAVGSLLSSENMLRNKNISCVYDQKVKFKSESQHHNLLANVTSCSAPHFLPS